MNALICAHIARIWTNDAGHRPARPPSATVSPRRAVKRTRWAAALVIATGICWLLTAQASAYVYWADNGYVARANLDGTATEPNFVQGGVYAPFGVAVDGQHLYWTSFGSIGRANLDGGAVNKSFITGVQNVLGVAVDSQHVYWADADIAGIGRANLDGSGVDRSFITLPATPRPSPRSVVVTGQHIYWTDGANGWIGRANLDGSGVDPTFIIPPNGPFGLATDGQHLYWTSPSGTIGRADVDGSHVNGNFITGTSGLSGVAVDGHHIYWTNRDVNTISRANLDGSGVEQTFIPPTDSPYGIAVDAGPPGSGGLTPSSARFGTQAAWTAGAPHSFTVTNVGHGDDLHIGQAAITSGDSEEFMIVGDGCSGASLPIGASCTIDVTFGPQGAGARTAQLTVPSDDPQGPVTASLSGAGAPDTTITSGPSGVTHDPTPTFGFGSSEPGASIQCRVDSRAFAPCASPRTLGALPDGVHTFAVRAIAAGVTDPTPATRSFTVKTAAIGVSGKTLTVTAAAGVADDMMVTHPSATTLLVSSTSGIHAGPKCTRRGDTAAVCASAGVAQIKLLAGDGPDRIVNATGIAGVLSGGTGNDLLVGGSAADSISGGAGADAMRGMGGDDRLLARDLTSDRSVDCGAGAHDKAPIDLLPKDPAAIVKGCEAAMRP